MKLWRYQWLGGYVLHATMRPDGPRWVVAVQFTRGRVAHLWFPTRDLAERQLWTANNRRPPVGPSWLG